ncbi:unnamed protein product [Fructobacillus fructosus]|nr:unnamed protein product [Fructobacillus fructosus]CAK1252519.1 unnamed protein product [Fructobacillus fructosus]CAK1252770.1 unnamed protein product [Fructobacillus fructosus]
MGECAAQDIATSMMGYESVCDIPVDELDEWNDLVNDLVEG